MGTIRQKKLAKAIVENLKAKKPKNKKEILVSVGYGELTADRNQKFIIGQEGVKEELIALGFNEYSAKKVVQEIMLDPTVEPSARLKASDQIFKVHGTYAPDKVIVGTIEISNERKKELNDILFNG